MAGVGQRQVPPRPSVKHLRLRAHLQGLAQGRRVAAGRVPARPIRAHQPLAQHVVDERRRPFRLAPAGPGRRRHPRPGAAGGSGAPGRRQIQLPAHRAGRGTPAQHGKYAPLPVADFAHLPEVLAAYPHAFVACFLPATRIEPQPLFALFACHLRQRGLHPAGHFVHDELPVPGGLADKTGQRIVAGIGQALVQALRVAAAGVKQALDILLTMRQLAMQTRPEAPGVTRHVRLHFFSVIGSSIP